MRSNKFSILYVRTMFIIFLSFAFPFLAISKYLHKRKIKKYPFSESFMVKFCTKNPWAYQLYNSIMNFPKSMRVYDVLPPISNKVLQVGAGTGLLNKYLKKYRNIDKLELFNLDINEYAIQYALNKKIYTNPIIADICKVPVDDDSFDMIVFSRCFHHVRSSKKAFLECNRILRKGGCIIICDMVSLSNKVPNKSFMANSNFDGFIWRYNPDAFRNHIVESLPDTLKVKSIEFVRQNIVTNYNFFYPHSDGIAIIEKI